MRWGSFIVITLLVIAIFLYERPHMKDYSKKEKRALASLTVTGWLLTLLLVLFPDLPGPTQLIQFIYHPLGKLLE
ncbi:hypothetical protein O9H85_25220 [Paenibacillus filicis]|uniref:Uncharacterized protein n=1 Tax=Paenibacillus gyeongsangnamensis TaxID=3388067 RepID=A0ABT4QFK5_9BACL|nr:hypothetical protein [Paenibacillus filicis]MCZ8515651.1 hypothetical protein [Paenibacillus filicis]